jgi:hypothetical protein
MVGVFPTLITVNVVNYHERFPVWWRSLCVVSPIVFIRAPPKVENLGLLIADKRRLYPEPENISPRYGPRSDFRYHVLSGTWQSPVA